jgi:hypothetical protein
LNLRPLGYEPSELPNCSTPRRCLYCMNSRLQKQIGYRGGRGEDRDPEARDRRRAGWPAKPSR